MRAAIRFFLLLALLPSLQTQAQASSREAREAVHDVRSRIDARDCAAAVQRLKAGLKAGHPEVSLLAGSMYDHGICVKPSWDNAVTFYTQAYQGKLPEAAERLAAGFADPARGPDAAAALWWSLRGRATRHAPCSVAPEAEGDPDRFVAALKTWDPSKLAICNYIVGVMSSINADVKYPRQAQAWGMHGQVTLRFLPAVPRVDLQTGADGAFRLFGWLDGDTLLDQEAGKAAEGFETTLRDAARHALRRYPQPAGIPAGAQVLVTYVFNLE